MEAFSTRRRTPAFGAAFGVAPRAALFLAAVCLVGPLAAQGTSLRAEPARGVLTRGPENLRGLPFFSPNAIPVLRAEYLIVPAAQAPKDAASAVDSARDEILVRVWFTREAVVLGRDWIQASVGERRIWLLPRPGERPVLALLDSRYAFIFELPADSPTLRSFAIALERRFDIFFRNAPSDAELSLPAFVDIPG